MDVALQRLRNQRLVGRPFATPEEVVGWLGAVQSQDQAGAKWAIALRTRAATDADIDRAFAAGRILRTHVLRPTWHFVLPDDIRWMLALTAPRVRAAMAYYDRKLALDGALFRRSQALLQKALAGGTALTRDELARALGAAGIEASGQRLGHIMMRAELDALVTSGPRRGKQFTYALLDERAPGGRRLAREEALAELAGRYFASHGPATPHDFAWWSGLTVGDARRGIESASPRLASATVDGTIYWQAPGAGRGTRVATDAAPAVHLLPNYDEMIVAYRDHAVSLARGVSPTFTARPDLVANHLVIAGGRVVGGWRRLSGKAATIVETMLAVRLDAATRAALRAAAARFEQFLAQPVTLRTRPARGGRMRRR
jgi:hypothetical protein